MNNSNQIKNKLQQDAINKFNKHYYDNNNTRGILCACCGYGKSYLIYKIIKECIIKKENLFIIATSRIKLIDQLGPQIYEWNKNEKNKWNLEISVFCSEDIFYKSDKKFQEKIKFNTRQEDIINKISNNKKSIINILITTYNSAPKIVNEISEYNKKIISNNDSSDELDNDKYIEPDLIILDEAHNTVGCSNKKNNTHKIHHELFKTNEYFEASKYLFMTATPIKTVHKNPNSKINTEETIYSMDNIKTYGKIFYYYTFSQAIDDKIITNFKTIYLEQNKDLFISQDIKDKLANLSVKEKELAYFREIGSLLIECMIIHKFNKPIVYISNKKKASSLKNILEEILKNYKEKPQYKFNFNVYKIVDDMTRTEKNKEQDKFINDERAILISVNIFNEGVDIPCVDSVMFAEERYSQSTIVQNIGRCLRIDPKNINKIAYVIIPNILYEIGDDKNEFYSSKFKVIRYCIKIIKNEKSENFFFKKYTDNKKTVLDENDNDNVDENIDDENNNNLKLDSENAFETESKDIIINNFDKHNIELLKYFNIKGTFDGFISNTLLSEIKNKYVIQMKINKLNNYGFQVKKDKNDHWLRLDRDYKNEWISWDNFFNNNTIKYSECKEIFKKLSTEFKIYINEWYAFMNIYNYLVIQELDEDIDYSHNNLFNDNIKQIDKYQKTNKKIYNDIIEIFLKIPIQPEKYFKSSNEWISMDNFLNKNEQIIINNCGNKNKDNTLDDNNELNKNLKNLLNNDGNKVKKNKWNILNIDIPDFIIRILIEKKIYNKDKISLLVQFRLNKNNIYDSSIIILQDKIKNNIFGKIFLDECKIEYMDKLLNNLEIDNDKIKLNITYCFDTEIENKINIFINEIRKNITKNIAENITKDNFIIKNIENKFDTNLNNKDIDLDIEIPKSKKLIEKENNNLTKILSKCGTIWSEEDKTLLINLVSSKPDITISFLIKSLQRNEAGIIIKLLELIEKNKINEQDIMSKSIKECIYKERIFQQTKFSNYNIHLHNNTKEEYETNNLSRYDKYGF